MKKADTWMPLYVGDYLADTARLTLEQHGAYLLLIMDYWRNGPPPDDDATIARVLRTSVAAWRRIAPAVRPLFKAIDGRLRHKRIDKEIVDANEAATAAHSKAQHAANVRWGKPDAVPQAMLQALPQEVHEQCASPSPSKELQKPPSTRSAVEGFGDFWKAYPRRIGKQDAVRAWQRIAPDELTRQRILRAIGAWAATEQWRSERGRFIPHPATWLNGKRWEDELPLAAEKRLAM